MKKHPNIILLLALIAAVIFFAVSCKNEPAADSGNSGSGDPAPQGVTMPVSKETGKQNLLELGADDPSRAIVSGFSIKATLNSGTDVSAIEIGGSDAIYWLGTDEDNNGTIDKYHYFIEKDNKTWYNENFYWVEAMEGSLMSLVFNDAVDALLFGAYDTAMQAGMKFVEKSNLGGRACSVYSTSAGNQTLKFWVDDQFGITLKMEYEGTSSISYTIDAKLSGLNESTELPDLYTVFHDNHKNNQEEYVRTGRTVADLAGTWSLPYGLNGGTLTITSGGSATLNQNSNDYVANITIAGMIFTISVPERNITATGWLAAPDSLTSFSLKKAAYSIGGMGDDNSTLTFTKQT